MANCVELKEGSENIGYFHCDGGCYLVLFVIILGSNNNN